MIATLPHWSLVTPLTLGGTTGKEMRNISGPEVIQVSTPVSAELKGNASMLPSNATVTPWRQCNYPIVVSCNFSLFDFFECVVSILSYERQVS